MPRVCRRLAPALCAWAALLLLFVTPAALAGDDDAALRVRLEQTSGRARVDLLNQLSKSQWGVSSDETIAWADKAIALARSLHYDAGEACALRYKAVGYWYQDDYKNALDYCLRALAIFDRIGDADGIVGCRNTIGTIYLNLDRFDDALATYRAALPMAERLGDHNRAGVLLCNIGTALLGKKQPEEALRYFERALPIAQQYGTELDRLTALGNLAGAYRRLGRYEEALKINRQIIDVAARSGSKVRLVDATTDIGEILGEMGRYDEGLQWVQKAIDLATKEDLKRNITDAELVMVKLYEKGGDYRSALEHQKHYTDVRQTVISDENTKAMAELQVKYESEKKEREIQTQRLEIERQISTRNLLIALSVLGLVLLVATYGRYRAKKRESALLERLSRTDPLTGLANRRAMLEALERELARSRREARPLSLAIVDVDHFKQFNDRFGHDAGDEVLVGVARALKHALREIDLVARWGGEEFLVMLSGADHGEAARVAERMRERLREVALERDGQVHGVTATFGVSPLSADETIDDCLKRADLALYRGKEEGRDRVVVMRDPRDDEAVEAASA